MRNINDLHYNVMKTEMMFLHVFRQNVGSRTAVENRLQICALCITRMQVREENDMRTTHLVNLLCSQTNLACYPLQDEK